MRICFLGTPDFAVPSLKALVDNGYDIVSVFTQPDRPKDRGKKTQASPVKTFALEHGLEVFQPERIKARDGLDMLRQRPMDIMVTAAFGQILSQEILDMPKLGCINVHGSLLPEYRGPAPIQWAVINGEKTTGVCTMYTDIGIDTGDVILSEPKYIGEDETSGELFARLSELGADLLIKTLRLIERGEAKRYKQDESRATYFPMISKDMACIDWSKTTKAISDLCRGMDPSPGAYSTFSGQRIKIFKVKSTDEQVPDATPHGTVLHADDKNGLLIACGDGAVEVVQLQAAGGKRMMAKDYLRGKSIGQGTVAGQ